MVTKERLEELMRNCAVIYGIEFDKIESYDLSDEDICISPAEFGDYGLRIFNSLGYWNDVRFENLFESKKEAEWYKEFGCIQRTEQLKLPTWQEFKNQKIHTVCFFSKNTNCFFEMFIHEKNNKLVLYDHDCDYKYFNDIATKENYIKACRIAKAHFLGEE